MPNVISLPTLSITGATVWMFFAFVIAVWVIATLVLEYHWENYAVNEQKIVSVRFLYRAGSFFFLAIIFLTVISYSLS
jgi:hypothetical protein